jgi:hypothetical protein
VSTVPGDSRGTGKSTLSTLVYTQYARQSHRGLSVLWTGIDLGRHKGNERAGLK